MKVKNIDALAEKVRKAHSWNPDLDICPVCGGLPHVQPVREDGKEPEWSWCDE